jgi:hypothetical protein
MPRSFVIVDENGNEFTAVTTEEVTVFDATPMDVRVDKIFASENGVQVGMKTIPSYHTTYGHKIVASGAQISIFVPEFDFSNLFITITTYNNNIYDSFSATYVAIDGGIYRVGSGEKISDITVDETNEKINLNMNATEKSVVRYLVTKEEF